MSDVLFDVRSSQGRHLNEFGPSHGRNPNENGPSQGRNPDEVGSSHGMNPTTYNSHTVRLDAAHTSLIHRAFKVYEGPPHKPHLLLMVRG